LRLGLVAVVLGCAGLTAGCGSSNGDHLRDKPAAQVLAEAQAAIRSVQSYRVDGMLDPGFTVHLVIVRGGSMGTVTAKGVTWSTIAYRGQLWLRGRALWQKTLTQAKAAQLGDSWVLVDDLKAAFNYARTLPNLDETIPAIVFGRHPKLQNKGERVVAGQRVVRLEDDEDIYDVLAAGKPYPVSWLEKENPGPDGTPCGITLRAFDAPAVVTPPTSFKTLT
jgi:hypothetical protein